MKPKNITALSGITGRFEHLDGLRGILALVVIMCHGLNTFDLALETGDPASSHSHWDIWLSGAPFQPQIAAHLAVCLFFVMSGFVLIGAFDSAKMGVVPLLVKRYTRLAIPVTCACIFSFLLLDAGLMANHQIAGITRSAWLGEQFQQTPSLLAAFREGAWGTFAHASNVSKTYDSSLWTMQIELAGSIGMLLTCCAVKRLTSTVRARKTAYIVLFSTLCLGLSESYLGLFAAGALIRYGLPFGYRPLNNRPKLAMALLIFGMFLGTVPVSQASWQIFHIFPNLWVPRWMPWPAPGALFWHMIGAVLIVLALQSSPPIQGFLKLRICQWLGAISFPLYLIHIPILMSLGSHIFLVGTAVGLPYVPSAAAALVIFAAGALLSAHIFTLIIERRTIRFSGHIATIMQSFLAVSRQNLTTRVNAAIRP
jgi:peptidoglycan/LPS O-acetylase OafA/YrhL